MGRKSNAALLAEAIARKERTNAAGAEAAAAAGYDASDEAGTLPADRTNGAETTAQADRNERLLQMAASQSNNVVNNSAPYSLVLYRHYEPPRDKGDDVLPGARRMNEHAEAVLHKVLSLDNVPSLLMAMNGEWILHREGKRVKLCADVHLHITRVDRSEWNLRALELTLSSNKKTATQLVRYVEELHEEYIRHVNNALGDRIYFFDHKEAQDFRGNPYEGTASALAQKRFEILNAPKALSFQQIPFYSNKTFDNLSGPETRLIAQRLRYFLDHKDKYDQKGIPYQLGLLLSGASGSGKSSCIRAMANLTRRHIVNLNFADIKTVTQLKKLFFSEELMVYRDDDATRECVRLRVPIDRRIYVLEEIDALGKTVGDRRTRASPADASLPSVHSMHSTPPSLLAPAAAPPVHDEITLGTLLQVMDGNMEVPGRIIVITSNQPELLDEALIRPGRIDVNVRFGMASRDTVAEMLAKMHDGLQLDPEQLARVPDGLLSPAEVMEVMFRCFGEPPEHMAALVTEKLAERGKARAASASAAAAAAAAAASSSSSSADAKTHVALTDEEKVRLVESETAARAPPGASPDETFDAYLRACADQETLECTRGGNRGQ